MLQAFHSPCPELAGGIRSLAYCDSNRLKRQMLLIPQYDDLTLFVRQTRQRVIESIHSLFTDGPLAGGLMRAGQLGSSATGRWIVMNRPFQSGVALPRFQVKAAKIGQVVEQNPPQPGQHFILRRAGEFGEVALGLEKRLLNEVRPASLGLQLFIELAVGDQQQILSANIQGAPKRLA